MSEFRQRRVLPIDYKSKTKKERSYLLHRKLVEIRVGVSYALPSVYSMSMLTYLPPPAPFLILYEKGWRGGFPQLQIVYDVTNKTLLYSLSLVSLRTQCIAQPKKI